MFCHYYFKKCSSDSNTRHRKSSPSPQPSLDNIYRERERERCRLENITTLSSPSPHCQVSPTGKEGRKLRKPLIGQQPGQPGLAGKVKVELLVERLTETVPLWAAAAPPVIDIVLGLTGTIRPSGDQQRSNVILVWGDKHQFYWTNWSKPGGGLYTDILLQCRPVCLEEKLELEL